MAPSVAAAASRGTARDHDASMPAPSTNQNSSRGASAQPSMPTSASDQTTVASNRPA